MLMMLAAIICSTENYRAIAEIFCNIGKYGTPLAVVMLCVSLSAVFLDYMAEQSGRLRGMLSHGMRKSREKIVEVFVTFWSYKA